MNMNVDQAELQKSNDGYARELGDQGGASYESFYDKNEAAPKKADQHSASRSDL